MEEQKQKGKRSGIRLIYAAGIAALAVILVAVAAVYFLNTAAGSTVGVGDSVSVFYTGSFTNGTVFSSNRNSTPFNFTVGANQVIPGFDEAVIGMAKGESKTVTLPPDVAYGYFNQSRVISAPLSDFGNNAPTVGEIITTNLGSQGEVTAVNATNATVNFNPPLAGKTLVFNITVVAIRK